MLDISKTCMYRFHYDFMKKHLSDKCKLLYTDTDSLVYVIYQHNIYNIMKNNIEEFDTSDYPEDNRFGIPRVNKKIPGKQKDECLGNIMTHFIGLRSKMYCVKVEGQKPINKAEGIKKVVAEKKITYDDHHKCLFDNEIAVREQHVIRSRSHNLHTEVEHKVALSYRDYKRYLIPNSTDTYPWGHYAIPSTAEKDYELPAKKSRCE